MTVVNDDGRVRWGELSAVEKIARTTQKTFHFGIILTGAVLTVEAYQGLSLQPLIPAREESHICYIQRSSLLRVRQGTSTVLWTRFAPTLGSRNYSVPARKFELLESRHGTNGLEQDLLRKSLRPVRLALY